MSVVNKKARTTNTTSLPPKEPLIKVIFRFIFSTSSYLTHLFKFLKSGTYKSFTDNNDYHYQTIGIVGRGSFGVVSVHLFSNDDEKKKILIGVSTNSIRSTRR